MPKVRVLEKSFINNTIVEEGEIVEYEGKLGTNLELVEEEDEPKPAIKKWKAGKSSDTEPADAI